MADTQKKAAVKVEGPFSVVDINQLVPELNPFIHSMDGRGWFALFKRHTSQGKRKRRLIKKLRRLTAERALASQAT